jgi:hypothetical protein
MAKLPAIIFFHGGGLKERHTPAIIFQGTADKCVSVQEP